LHLPTQHVHLSDTLLTVSAYAKQE
jgi:hypothetical protein